MSEIPRPLLATFAVVSIVTIALAALVALPARGLQPLRSWPIDLDEPAGAPAGPDRR